ncbi:MAG: hypothetical protein JW931_05015 [Methanomicrobiaceae archaeon]|nr:hypothetical protein [Methanomicrobiaceae archaeon]
MKKITMIIPEILIATAVVPASAGCVNSDRSGRSVAAGSPAVSSGTTTAMMLSTIEVEYKDSDLNTDWDESGSIYIFLKGNTITPGGAGAETDGSTPQPTASIPAEHIPGHTGHYIHRIKCRDI